jgi:thiol-disulfide isomerase/thioredoxin
MRLAIFTATLLLLMLSACRKTEAFIDEGRRFEALEGGINFALDATPKEIHKLIVNFFAPDCPPCEKEIPALKKFYEKYRQATDVGFIAIGSSLKAIEQNPKPGKDPPLTAEQIKAEIFQFGKKFEQPYRRYWATAEDLKAWRVTGFPETLIFIREAGRLGFRKKIISEVTLEDLEREISGK